LDSCGESLYADKSREELNFILQSLKQYYEDTCSRQKKGGKTNEEAQIKQLIEYFEILLSVTEWKGKLIASF